MKKLIFFFHIFICTVISISAVAQTSKKESALSTAVQIEAYYFHNTARCVTCKAVEAEAKADLHNLYGNTVTFKSLNLEDAETKAIAKKLNVSGQTLIIVKGSKKVNLTNEGFLYAKTNPAKFKAIIKEKVDAL